MTRAYPRYSPVLVERVTALHKTGASIALIAEQVGRKAEPVSALLGLQGDPYDTLIGPHARERYLIRRGVMP